MAGKVIRIGKVSSVDYENGMIKVTYPDLDNAVTDDLPVMSFNGEYKMPEIGKEVLVLHLSNGTAAGIALGPYWNKRNQPAESGPGLYRKELGSYPGEAFAKCVGGVLEINAAQIVFVTESGSVTVAELLALLGR